MSEIIEPEILFNPLDEAVNVKPYTTPNVNTSGINFNIPIEEPRFNPPPIEKAKTEEKKSNPEPLNPDLKNLNKKDTEMAASAMAKIFIQGYEWINDLANKGLQISEKKLNKLQAQGEINLNAMIDYDYGKKIRAGDFFIEWNEQVKTTFVVSQEFKDEVTPILERILAKRGIGMTDEQLLMFIIGNDLATKGMIFVQMKNQTNLMISSIKDATMTASSSRPQAQREPKPEPPEVEVLYSEPEEVSEPIPERKKRIKKIKI